MSRNTDVDTGWAATMMLGAVVAIISLPAVLLAVPLVALVKRNRAAMLTLAIAGLGTTALLYPSITTEMEDALAAIRRRGGFWERPEQALEAAWPHVRAWWLMALGIRRLSGAGRPGTRAKGSSCRRCRTPRRSAS